LQDSSIGMRWPEPHSGRSTRAGGVAIAPVRRRGVSLVFWIWAGSSLLLSARHYYTAGPDFPGDFVAHAQYEYEFDPFYFGIRHMNRGISTR
jgi:hypothetical protein